MVNSLTVLKFGSSVLPTEDHLGIAVREVQYWTSRGHRVIAVVSAMGDATDRLLDRARKDANTNGHADECATAALLATGEATTAALLGLALAKAGTPASVLDAAAIGLRTEGPILDSRAVDLDRGAVHRALARRSALVVPGFLGRDEHGQTTLLGRGGSDLTALFLAGELFADQCVLLKDVDGLYDRDPSEDPVGARRYLRANYQYQQYVPLSKQYTLAFNGELGYGKGLGGRAYPLFKNFYGGGLGSVRGFDQGTLGPVSPITSGVQAGELVNIGGNRSIALSAEFITPFPGAGNDRTLRYSDPRRFGCMLWLKDDPFQHPLLKSLGPEPLSEEFTGATLFDGSRGRKVPVKAFIMDSHVVVGVGNIYASEALFRAGILPRSAAHKITKPRMAKLVAAIREVLTDSIREGGTTLRDFLNSDGEPGYFKQRLFVYERKGEPCRICTTPIRHAVLGQRSTYWCPKCQK